MDQQHEERKAMNPTETLVPIALFAMIFGIVYVTITASHRQRMAMIEKGMDPTGMNRKEIPLKGLRNGMLLMAVGLGLYLGYLMDSTMPQYGMNGDMDDTPLPYFIMVMLCGGLALVLHYFIARRKQQG